MPELKSSLSAPTPSSGHRAQFLRGRSKTSSHPQLTRVFSAQHLDDVSHYHSGDHDSAILGEDDETEYSDELDRVTNEDYDEAARERGDEVPEVRMGVRDARDIEAKLEKKHTTRSIKDPNLVQGLNLPSQKGSMIN